MWGSKKNKSALAKYKQEENILHWLLNNIRFFSRAKKGNVDALFGIFACIFKHCDKPLIQYLEWRQLAKGFDFALRSPELLCEQTIPVFHQLAKVSMGKPLPDDNQAFYYCVGLLIAELVAWHKVVEDWLNEIISKYDFTLNRDIRSLIMAIEQQATLKGAFLKRSTREKYKKKCYQSYPRYLFDVYLNLIERHKNTIQNDFFIVEHFDTVLALKEHLEILCKQDRENNPFDDSMQKFAEELRQLSIFLANIICEFNDLFREADLVFVETNKKNNVSSSFMFFNNAFCFLGANNRLKQLKDYADVELAKFTASP